MFTQVQLETKTGPELVAVFNGIEGVSPVKRFRTRQAGVQRILTTYGNVSVEVAEVAPVAEVTEVVAKVKKVRGIYNEPRKELIRIFRPNSRRGRLITLLLNEGATFDQLLVNKEVGFPQEDVLHKTIRILNWWTGYGLTTNADGVIFLTS